MFKQKSFQRVDIIFKVEIVARVKIIVEAKIILKVGIIFLSKLSFHCFHFIPLDLTTLQSFWQELDQGKFVKKNHSESF